MRSLLPLTVYCISLVSLQQLLALPAGERPDSDSLDLRKQLNSPEEDSSSASGRQIKSIIASPAPSQSPKWLSRLLRHPGVKVVHSELAWAQPSKARQSNQRASRTRRHAHLRGRHHYPHNAQLMRVGCVLGTCQVQNLSHRLYQLIGQNGREDSSPINPKSPHSYG